MFKKGIKYVGRNRDYLNENSRFAKVIFFNEYMGVKKVSLKNFKFSVVLNDKDTIDKTKECYRASIAKNLNMDEDFQNKYKDLVELILYNDYLIILKFSKKNYLKFLNIKKGYMNYNETELLFAPYLLEIELEYTTYEDKELQSTIELTFDSYSEDTLIISKVCSEPLTIDAKKFSIPDYVIICRNHDDKKNKIK